MSRPLIAFQLQTLFRSLTLAYTLVVVVQNIVVVDYYTVHVVRWPLPVKVSGY